jgi:hypothetical protein
VEFLPVTNTPISPTMTDQYEQISSLLYSNNGKEENQLDATIMVY